MKMFFVLLLALPISSFAVDCMVDGISDSPQKYSCVIRHGLRTEKLELSCVEGKYQVQWQGKVLDITTAYHEEVETGDCPLVFVADQLTLTTTSHKARLVSEGKKLSGNCK